MSSAPAARQAAPAPNHAPEFRRRRFMNWLPLGITYATFCMGRYNLDVASAAIMKTFGLSKAEFGTIATAGFWTYALSVIFNGPIADRFGGRRAILVAGAGTAFMNLVIGLAFFSGWQSKIVVGLGLMSAVNQYFQSFATPSIVKVNSHWFHVRERGVFGGVFGVATAAGYFLALTVGGWILARLPWYAVFLVPSAAIAAMLAVDFFSIADEPRHAGHADLDTDDVSSASSDKRKPIDRAYLITHVFRNKVVLILAAAEFCTGFVRQGLLLWFVPFLKDVYNVNPGSEHFSIAANGVTVGAVAGGLLSGWMSDKLFHSRRAPAAVVFYLAQIGALFLLGWTRDAATACCLIGFSCVWIFGVHGMLSGAASMDFGGTKAAATVAGLLDGAQSLASGLAGLLLGGLIDKRGWGAWTYAIMPFSLAGALLMATLWNATPKSIRAGLEA